MVATKKRGEEFNWTQQKAILALAYLTRCKAGKAELYEQQGIRQFAKVIKAGELTTGSMNETLQILWNLVYIDMYETPQDPDQMRDVVPLIVKYLRSEDSTIEGRTRSYFIFAHLCHRHANYISECGVIQRVFEDLREFSQKPQEGEQFPRQLLEGACRLVADIANKLCLSTFLQVAENKEPNADVVDQLLKLFELREEDFDFEVDMPCMQDRTPKDAYKMRAAQALDSLCSQCEEGSAGEECDEEKQKDLKKRIMRHIEELLDKDRSKHSTVETIMWLSIQPSINQELIQNKKIMQQLMKLRDADVMLKCNSESSDCRYDLIILLVATIQNKAELFELLDLNCDADNCTVWFFMLNKQSSRWPLNAQSGHTMCSRWAAMSKAIQLVTHKQADNECRINVHELGQGRSHEFYLHLVEHVMGWLEHGGHPYKVEGEKLMNILAQEKTAFHYIVQFLVKNCADRLIPETLRELRTLESAKSLSPTPSRNATSPKDLQRDSTLSRISSGSLKTASTDQQLKAVAEALHNLCHR